MIRKLKTLVTCLMTMILVFNVHNIKASSELGSLSQVKQDIIDEFKKQESRISLLEGDGFSDNSIIVKYANDISENEKLDFEKNNGLKMLKVLNRNLNMYLYALPLNVLMSLEILNNINKSTVIEYAEPNYNTILIQSSDPYYNLLWPLKNNSYPGIDINVENAWLKTKGRESVIVAVLDTGVDFTHEDLKDNMWKNDKEIPNNGIDDDKNGYIDDIYGWDFHNNNNDLTDDNSHGTHVAGTIAAVENTIGVIGVAPLVKIMPIKIFGSNGEINSFSDIILAIEYAYNNGATVANMSFGGIGKSTSLYDEMEYASSILFVSAAGNRGANNDTTPVYPASYELTNNIAVASIDKNGALSTFSNYGAINVDVAAPGSDIISTIPGNKYAYKSGTSMASPHVAGVAALIKSYDLNVNPERIKDILIASDTKLSSLSGKIVSGGMINTDAALNMIKSQSTLEPQPEPTPMPEPQPEPIPTPAPQPEPAPIPEPQPEPTPTPESQLEPTPEPIPIPVIEPTPITIPIPEAQVEIIPTIEPQLELTPEAKPIPVIEPAPITIPIPEPQVEIAPTTESQPVVELVPEPNKTIEAVFPDVKLQNEIARQLNKSVDDTFTTADSEKIKILSLTEVNDATGIETLSNLETLSLTRGNLASIDLTKNTSLKQIHLSYNKLTSLDLRNNTECTEVYANYNPIKSIMLADSSSLKIICLAS